MAGVSSGRAPRLSSLAIALAIVATDLHAQEPQIDEGGVRLVPEEKPDIEHGKASILQGETGPDGDRYFIQHLNITQPVTVVLIAANPDDPLTLNLSKYRYDESDRRGDTGADGTVSFDFRTQGELKIKVTPKDGNETARYFLIAWVGDDITPQDLPPPTTIAGESDGGAGLPILWIVLGALVALGAGVAFFVMRGRKAA